MTISPGLGIRLDLPNYAPGLAVIPVNNLEEVRRYSRLKKTRPYRMALTIGLFMLLAACSSPQIGENLEPGTKSSASLEDKPSPGAGVNKKPEISPEKAGMTNGLSRFYTALAQLGKGQRQQPVVVVHLGDSHIAADRFSGDLRQRLQQRFGDAGRGLVQPGKPYRYFNARGVSTQQSDGWKSANSFYNAPGPYSLTGVRLEAETAGETLKLMAESRVKDTVIEVEFLTGPKAGSVKITAAGISETVNLSAPEVKLFRIKKKARTLVIKTLDEHPVDVLGWSVLVQRSGVRYVSFGLPGASAGVMKRWDRGLVRAELKELKPDLIILGYGTNEGFRDDLDPAAYQRRYEVMATQLKKLAGNPSLLVLGPPDSTRLPKYARKKGAELGCKPLSSSEIKQYATLLAQKSNRLARWHAPPGLARVRKALRRAAKNMGAAYWDWSQVMGGACGTFTWAKARPALAFGDNVHFTDAGSKRSAAALYKFLMKGYAQFSLSSNQPLVTLA